MGYSRICYDCKLSLNYQDYLESNLHLKIEYLEKIWNDPCIELLCCICYKQRIDCEYSIKLKTFKKAQPLFFKQCESLKWQEIFKLQAALEIIYEYLNSNLFQKGLRVILIQLLNWLEAFGIYLNNFHPNLIPKSEIYQKLIEISTSMLFNSAKLIEYGENESFTHLQTDFIKFEKILKEVLISATYHLFIQYK